MYRPQADDPDNSTPSLSEFAIHLLELQQRLNAFDSLYNEEVMGLSRDLTQLKAEFLRHYRTSAMARPAEAQRQRSARTTTQRKTSKRRSGHATAQKEESDDQSPAR
ncbi:MAG TPA: hypothetical protein VF808_15885 [Ktedonobacterales bacterium]